MPRYAIGMTTHDRKPNPNYINQTMESMRIAKVFEYADSAGLTVSSSTSMDTTYLNQVTVKHPKVEILWPEGFPDERKTICANENVSRVIKHCCNKGGDLIMYIQDDVKVRPDFLAHVDAFIRRNTNYPMWSFHAAYQEVLNNARRGKDLWVYPYEKYYGSLCWVMRRRDAAAYANYLYDYAFKQMQRGKMADIFLSRWLKTNHPGKSIAASCPSYVQHTGEISSLGHAGFRRNQSYDHFFK